MKKVNYYAAEVRYTGRFEDYSDLELFELARARADRNNTDCSDYSIEVEDDEAEKLDGTYSIDNKYPGNKLAVVHWCYIDETEEDEDDDDVKGMTISELLNNEAGNFDSYEVYEQLNDRNFNFHTDSIREIDADLNMIVKDYEIMDETSYNKTVLANCCEVANFAEWYDNKDAKILVIAV